MDTNVIRLTVFRIMKMLNLTMVIFLSLVTFVSITKVSKSMNAKGFLEGVSQLPPVPWTVPVLAIGGCIVLLCLMDIQRYFGVYQWIAIFGQIFFGMVVIFSLQMNYNGIILLVAAQLLSHFKEHKEKLAFLALTSVFLLIFDFHLCEKFMKIISFEACTQYYKDVVSSLLLVCKSIGTTCNMILFIMYTILLLREQIDENEKVQDLNEQLNLTNIELQHANHELAVYARESERMAQTKERNRLAREIHDTLGHTLTGIIAGLDAALAILPISTEQTKKQLELIGDVARKGMTDVRRSVNALRPDVLERQDLLSAIQQTILEMSTTSNVEIHLNNEISKFKFNEDEEEVIYRIIQESITNSIRHGKATKVDIHMKKEYSIIILEIKDNGVGAKEIKQGFGLTHMMERLEMLKGELHVESKDGFMVRAKIPIRWGERE